MIRQSVVVVNEAGGKWARYAIGKDDGVYNLMLVEKERVTFEAIWLR